jgi:hypothetical protein
MNAMIINMASRIAGPVGMTAMVLALQACGAIGNPLEALGSSIPPPDEFQVIARAPLVMPATTNLPEPTPGAPSPLEPNPHRDAQMALLGTFSSPVVETITPSAGEQVLLSSANAAAASSDIRVQLEEEKITEAENKPYEAPSIGALFGGSSEEKVDEETLLDPVAESQRLQREGYVTPADPKAVAEVEGESSDEPILSYPTGRPKNTFIVN